MTLMEVEKRLTRLEETVAKLTSRSARQKDWRRTIGMFKDDPFMTKVFDEAHNIRERDRAKARLRKPVEPTK